MAGTTAGQQPWRGREPSGQRMGEGSGEHTLALGGDCAAKRRRQSGDGYRRRRVRRALIQDELTMGVRGGAGAERAEGAFPGRTAHPRSRSDPWAQIQMNSELVGALSGTPALISPDFTEKRDASALRGRAGGSRHGAGLDARPRPWAFQ